MKKVDNKGFMLVETLIVATLIISVLIYLFIQFQTIAKSYNTSFNYNTVDAAYGVSNIRNYILSDGYEELLNYQNTANNGYVDITNCNSEYFEETEYCLSLFDQLNVKTVLFTKNNLSNLKSKNFTFNEKLKSFINYIKYDNEKVYRIIVEYKNGTFGSLKISKPICFTFESETGTIKDYNTACSSIVEVPASIDGITVTKIGANAFANKGITSLTLASVITEIGDYAFANNLLTELTIPETVTSYGIGSFSHNNLTSLTINLADELECDKLTIGVDAFRYNKIPQGNAVASVHTVFINFGENSFANNGVDGFTTITLEGSIGVPGKCT